MDEQQAVTPVRTRRRPSWAGRGHRAALEGLTLALVVSLGLLAGVGLSYGAWIWPGQQEEAPIAAASPDPSPPTELVVSETAPPTQPATEPSTQPMTEATEPETEPPTQPPTEPRQEEPAAVTEPPATEPPATEPPEPDFAVTGYILPNSSTEYLTWEDYASLSRWELVLARNEIFARHGRLFQNQDIQAYFNSCSWYEGTIAPEDFDTSVMNDIEVQNVRTLKAAEG